MIHQFVMSIIEIIIQPDGKIMLPRGSEEQNKKILEMFKDNDEDLESFFDLSSETIISSKSPLCG